MAPVQAQPVEVIDAYARVMARGERDGAAYMMVLNRGGAADRLIAVSSPDVAVASLSGEGQGVAVPAGGAVLLAPTGPHVLLRGLRHPFAEGQILPLTLRFEKAGAVQVDLPLAVDTLSNYETPKAE